MELSKKSYVYRFMDRWSKVFGTAHPDKCNDLCTLAKSFILTFLVLVLSATPLFIILTGTVQIILYYLFGVPIYIQTFVTAAALFWGIGISVLVCVGFVLVGVGIAWLFSTIHEGYHNSQRFLVAQEAYRGWKEKYCPTVRWKND